VKALLAIAFLAACGGKLPETRFYQLAAPESHAAPSATSLVLEPLTTDGAYDDERIVYRTSPYRLDYYQYHRWSSAPGTMIGNYLEQALGGHFQSIAHELTGDAPVILTGRVIAIEEVDRTPFSWAGRIAIALTLTDAKTNKTLWTQQFDEREPMTVQTPEGLARALTTAMNRIVAKIIPIVSELAERTAQRLVEAL
jgi:ABC-type uncharacterized transport system auxiliary subunit